MARNPLYQVIGCPPDSILGASQRTVVIHVDDRFLRAHGIKNPELTGVDDDGELVYEYDKPRRKFRGSKTAKWLTYGSLGLLILVIPSPLWSQVSSSAAPHAWNEQPSFLRVLDETKFTCVPSGDQVGYCTTPTMPNSFRSQIEAAHGPGYWMYTVTYYSPRTVNMEIVRIYAFDSEQEEQAWIGRAMPQDHPDVYPNVSFHSAWIASTSEPLKFTGMVQPRAQADKPGFLTPDTKEAPSTDR